MDESQSQLQDRVAALEKAVAELRAQLDPRPTAATPTDAGGEIERIRLTTPPKRRKSAGPKRRKQTPSISLPDDPEVLLKWAGIGLVVLSIAFLFKYAVDEDWLTPTIQVVLGGVLGLILLGIGGLVYSKRARFGQVLQGGGIAAFYITLFAGFQLLDVLDNRTSFAGMVVVTLAGFALGLYQKDPPLVVLGLLGGLATPFLLYTGQGDVPGLMSYTCLLLAATTVIYLSYGWRSVLYVTVVGGWLVFAIAQSQLPWDVSLQTGDRLAIQLAVVFGVIAFWLAPVVREVLRLQKPDAVSSRDMQSQVATSLERVLRNVVHQLIVVTPLVAIALSAEIWRLPKTQTGLISAGATAVYVLVALALRSDAVKRVRYSHAVMSGLLATLTVVLLLDGNGLLVCLAAEVAVLHILASKLSDKLLRSGAHALFVIVALWMWIRLADHTGVTPPIVNIDALSDLVALALAVAAALSVRVDQHQRVYFALTYAGALAWLYRELSTFPNGQAYVSAAWGLIGVSLLIFGLRRHKEMIRGAGLATLVLVVGKLFVVDLAQLDSLWRVAVFLGIGAGFLTVGYFLPQLWKPLVEQEDAPTD
jgi:uncharacterized membrane protein